MSRSRFSRSAPRRDVLAQRYGRSRRRRCTNCGRVCVGNVCSTACGGRSTGKNLAKAALTTLSVMGGLMLIGRALSR
jgi:hypothetical protein